MKLISKSFSHFSHYNQYTHYNRFIPRFSLFGILLLTSSMNSSSTSCSSQQSYSTCSIANNPTSSTISLSSSSSSSSSRDYLGLAKNQHLYPIAYTPSYPPVGTQLPLYDSKDPSKHILPVPSNLPLSFQPITINGITLKNRFVVSPMCMYSSTDGFWTGN